MGDRNNLAGLKLVFAGFIIQIIAAVIGGSSAGSITKSVKDTFDTASSASGTGISNVLSVITALMSVAALILIIVGLSAVKNVSPYFKKSRNLYIANILVAFAMMVVVAILAGSTLASASSSAMTGTSGAAAGAIAGTVIASVLIAVAMAVISILAIRAMMLGCRDVAEYNGDTEFAGKCRGTWRLYLLASIIMVVAGTAFVIFGMTSLVSMFSYGSAATSMNTGAIAGGLIGAMLFLIAAFIFIFVVQIMIMVRVWGTYSRFNGGNHIDVTQISDQTTDQRDSE